MRGKGIKRNITDNAKIGKGGFNSADRTANKVVTIAGKAAGHILSMPRRLTGKWRLRELLIQLLWPPVAKADQSNSGKHRAWHQLARLCFAPQSQKEARQDRHYRGGFSATRRRENAFIRLRRILVEGY